MKKELTNDQNIKNLKKRKVLRIFMIILAALTIILSVLFLIFRIDLLLILALISFIIAKRLKYVREKTPIIKKDEFKEYRDAIEKSNRRKKKK